MLANGRWYLIQCLKGYTSKSEGAEPCLLNMPCILIFRIWYLQTYSPCPLWSCRTFGTQLLSFLCLTWHLVIACWQTSPLLPYTLQHSTNGTVKTYSAAQIQDQNFEKRCLFWLWTIIYKQVIILHIHHLQSFIPQHFKILISVIQRYDNDIKYIHVSSCLQYHSQFVRFRSPFFDSAWLPVQHSQKWRHGMVKSLLLLRWYYSPKWTFTSLMDLSFKFVILHLLISVCTQFMVQSTRQKCR